MPLFLLGISGPWSRWAAAFALAGMAVVVARRGFSAWLLPAALWIVVVAVAAATPRMTLNGWHGQMHWAYALASTRQTPPEDPMFAGRPLLYPWIPHWMVGQVSRSLGAPVTGLMAIIDGLCLALYFFAAARTARLITPDRGAAGFAVLLAWSGWQVFDPEFLALIGRTWPSFAPDSRSVPADKFFQPNFNSIGLALSSSALLCASKVLDTSMRPWSAWYGVLLASLGCAFFYPLGYVGLCIALGTGGMILVCVHRRRMLGRLSLLALAPSVAGAAALPHLVAISRSKAPAAGIAMSSWSDFSHKLFVIAAASCVVMVIVLAGRRRLLAVCRARPTPFALLAGAGLGLSAAYLVAREPGACEYKFLGQGAAPVACLLSVPLARMSRRRPLMTVGLTAVLAAAGVGTLAARFEWRFPLPMTLDAAASGTDQGTTLAFIRDRTPSNAVIVSDDPLVTTVADKSLFSPPPNLGPFRGDGWSMPPVDLAVSIVGHRRGELNKRLEIAATLIGGAGTLSVADGLIALRQRVGQRPVYIVCRDADAARRVVEAGGTVVHDGGGRVVVRAP